jgi:hypothetical protein
LLSPRNAIAQINILLLCRLLCSFLAHQIMRFVRHLKLQPGYDPNTTHVVYGQVSHMHQLCLLLPQTYCTVLLLLPLAS